MKKNLIIGLFFVLAVAVAYFAASYEQEPKRRPLITKLDPLACDLNKGSCSYDYKGRKVLVELTPWPVPILQELVLKVKNLGDFKKLETRIYGLNMYMGTIIPEFKKSGLDYEAKVFLSSCVLDIMRYQFEFFDDDKPIGFSFMIDIKR